jgi:hypothetical protein
VLQPITEGKVRSPLAWIEAPEWLTLEEAAELSGHSLETIQWMVDEDAVDLKDSADGWLIEKRSLHEFQQTLAEVLHWDEV